VQHKHQTRRYDRGERDTKIDSCPSKKKSHRWHEIEMGRKDLCAMFDGDRFAQASLSRAWQVFLHFPAADVSSEGYNGALLVDGILQHDSGGVARTTVPVHFSYRRIEQRKELS